MIYLLVRGVYGEIYRNMQGNTVVMEINLVTTDSRSKGIA